MTEKGFRIVSDINREGWEKADFPILCETCMGDNPYVRMLREDYGTECKICSRPHTAFRWKPGTNARYKVVVVCHSCAKMKNVCQCCLFDLEYGLPVQVRDKYLEEHQKIVVPTSDVNRDFFLGQMDKNQDSLPYGKDTKNPMLARLARTAPYYKRNEARVCSFFVAGTCNRGDSCPYQHVTPEGGELAKQNMKDRFHGTDDPVAKKIMRVAEEKLTLHPPEDKSITTLYVGGLKEDMTDQDIRDKFYLFGEILSIRMALRQHCAFVTFETRAAAERAAEELNRVLTIKDVPLRLSWAKPQAKKGLPAAGSNAATVALPPQSQEAIARSTVVKPYYPSMDPAAQGNM